MGDGDCWRVQSVGRLGAQQGAPPVNPQNRPCRRTEEQLVGAQQLLRLRQRRWPQQQRPYRLPAGLGHLDVFGLAAEDIVLGVGRGVRAGGIRRGEKRMAGGLQGGQPRRGRGRRAVAWVGHAHGMACACPSNNAAHAGRGETQRWRWSGAPVAQRSASCIARGRPRSPRAAGCPRWARAPAAAPCC